MNGEHLVAAMVASILTIFDIDRTFYLPAKIDKKLQLLLWYWAFVLANGALALGLSAWIQQAGLLGDWNWVLRGLTVGGAYLAIIRAKFTTFDFGGRTIPFGFELIYEAAKDFAYKRINRIAKAARNTEATALADSKTLQQLGQQAKLDINQNALLNEDEKRVSKEWLLKVIGEAKAGDDFDQRATIADYLLSGRRGV